MTAPTVIYRDSEHRLGEGEELQLLSEVLPLAGVPELEMRFVRTLASRLAFDTEPITADEFFWLSKIHGQHKLGIRYVRAGAYCAEKDICPYCGHLADAEWVDIGIGLQQCSPYQCSACGATEIGPHGEPSTPAELRTGWYEPFAVAEVAELTPVIDLVSA